MQQILANLYQQIAKFHQAKLRVVAVSKYHTLSEVKTAYQLGIRDFAENDVKQLASRKAELKALDINWHFIGHIQSNKTKLIAENAFMVHSLSNLKHALRLNNQREAQIQPLQVLIEVNISREENKAGLCTYTEILELACQITQLPNLKLCGLMGMASHSQDCTLIKAQFKQLKTYLTQLNLDGFNLSELSMGMSNDYLIALECGATIIRLGELIFGAKES